MGVDLDDASKVKKLLVDNPVAAWYGSHGTGGTSYFSFADDTFRFLLDVPDQHREDFQQWVREIIDWRLAEYVSRTPSTWDAERVVCKVFQSNGNPILKLPNGCEERDAPWDWTPVEIEGEAHQANFVKIAVNVMRREGSDANVLPDVLRRWFGDDAGQPGTRFQVAFVRGGIEGYYRLEPVNAVDFVPTAQLGQPYKREDIPGLFGLEYKKGLWGPKGVIDQGGHLFLLVTLNVGRTTSSHEYSNRFVSANMFQWQSQSSTSQNSKLGSKYKDHQEQGIPVNLFVRPAAKISGKGAPFYYCGELEFERWEGEKPITIWWSMKESLPKHLHERMGL